MTSTTTTITTAEGDKTAPPALVCSIGSETTVLSDTDLRRQVNSFLERLGPRQDVLLLPPDFTRFHSQAGKITRMICEYYKFIPQQKDDDGDAEAETEQQKQSTKRPKVDPEAIKDQQEHPVPKIEILPALGTHAPMTAIEIRKMYGKELGDMHENSDNDSTSNNSNKSPFVVHDWRNDVVTIGHTPAELVRAATYGMVDEPWPAQLNKLVWEKRLDNTIDNNDSGDSNNKPKPLVLSIGQVVPHEVLGMANYNKNVFIGVGGTEAINLSHFIGAVHGMEKMMGRQNNPLRDILNYASQHFLERQLDLWYLLTVVSSSSSSTADEPLSTTEAAAEAHPSPLPPAALPSNEGDDGDEVGSNLCIRGLYIGRDIQCYSAACDLSLKVNFTLLDKPMDRCVVYLDPDEFHSTWLGNKAIYRTRMAMADGGKLVILAPGVDRFGEDKRVDALIRKYGYVGTPAIMKFMEQEQELRDNLSAVAHLIHGSSEGRFQIVYCPGHLTKEEIERAGFEHDNLDEMEQRYKVKELKDGWNKDQDGDFFYISNPALGLWSIKSRFESSSEDSKITDRPV
jgi:nickel-dependent lactate racemase